MLQLDAMELIKKHEGFSGKAYLCPAGRLTIGYGRNLEDRGITKSEAEYLLTNDIIELTERLQYVPAFKTLDTVRQTVLVDMAYNLGIDGLLGFKKMLACIVASDYDGAAKEMLDSRWAKQVGSRATELAGMMREGRA